MILIPGFLISLITFPGVIVHELAHVAFCKLTSTPVLQVCYFRLGNPAGFVIHQRPSSVWRHILIGIGPFFVNTLIALIIGVAVAVSPMRILHHMTVTGGVVLWLAISIGMHAFPSTGDAKAIWKAISSAGAPFTARIFGSPLVAIIWLGALGSIVWLDAIYGAAVVLIVPYAIPQLRSLTFGRIPNLNLNTQTSTTPTVGAPTAPSTESSMARERAIELYPDLAIANSKLNQEFIRRYQQYEKVNPGYFNNPEWPTYLAHESQRALLKH